MILNIKDRYILVGNHRDAWSFGAIDPSRGTSVMLEISRLLAHMKKTGEFVRKRTILFLSWGAEEYALIGSTEWVEVSIKNYFLKKYSFIMSLNIIIIIKKKGI